MKTTNLKSIATIYEHYQKDTPDANFLKFWGTNIKFTDLKTLNALLTCIYKYESKININFFNDFYIGYSIPQIGKEFDLLRFTDNEILNIELKREITPKIEYQLVKNKYYLKFLNKKLFLYTYVAKENKIYKLTEKDKLIEINIQELIDCIKKTYIEQNIITTNLDDYFIPSNYLISPFSKTEEFINNEYFLTKEQEEIEKDILKRIKNNEKAFLITGGAGSGKTLLTYHLAQKLQNNKKVALIHMGNLNSGHEKLKNEYGWNIQPIKFWELIYKNDIPDIIMIDEVQRANNKKQFHSIINYVEQNNIILIMSGDKNQTLRQEEGWAIEWENINKYKLNEKIRTNKELALFITVLFDLKRMHHIKPKDKNINIVYFDSLLEAKQYILNKNDYTYISYTPNTGNYGKYCEMHRLDFADVGTAHQVIGQEFENVITILDKNFYYDENNRLQANKVTYNPYSLRKMFFQQITRAINKLEIVVIENIEIYNKIMTIFE